MAIPSDFDAKKYLELNPDLVAAYGWDTTQATNHWNNWGEAEGRNYNKPFGSPLTNPQDFWAGSSKPASEISSLKAQGYAHPETYTDYGPGSASWNQDGGVNPNDPGWQDYINRTQASGRAKAAEQAAADDDDFLGGFAPLLMAGAGMYFGMPGLSSLFGEAAGAGAMAEGFGGAGILGDSAMWGLGEAAGAGALGGSAMDFSNLGDLWNYGSEAGSSSLSDLSAAADQFGWSDMASPGTSMGANADIGGSSWFNTLIEQAKANPLGTAAKAVKSVLGGGTGGSGGNSTGSNASLLSGLAKLYSAYNSEGNLKDAIGANQGAIDRAVNWQDPNQPRGNEANRLWMENYTNPKAGYNEFMTGAGRDFTEQARAAAAKSGKRGSYLNSGKMQSDLASLWMKNQFSRGDSLAKGFTSPRNYAADALRDSLGLSDLYKQKGGSIGMAVGDLLGSSQARELISNITGSYW